MKKYILSLGIALLSFGFTANANDGSCYKKADCCKECKDEQCKSTCAKVNSMTAEELKTEEGKKLVEECVQLCKKNGCCSKDTAKSCEKHNKKGCCK
jgi:hypothetical protein